MSESNFLRVIADGIDDVFQMKNDAEAKMVWDAYIARSTHSFTTMKGRRCVINFRRVHAVCMYLMDELKSNSEHIDGVKVYLAGHGDIDVQVGADAVDQFVTDLLGGNPTASLEHWLFDSDRVVMAISDIGGEV